MEPDYSDITVKNPRIGKVMRLEEEVQRQSEIEKLRSRRIRQEQEYIDRMSLSVENHLRNTKEEQRYNEQFEERIRTEVYRMHGISEDKLQGMTEYRNAWYQGTAFAMFFLSLVLIAICGILHGFGSEICIFMAFYTAIEGALLSNGRKQSLFFTVLTKGVYLLLFPVMLVTFTCYELGLMNMRFWYGFRRAGVVVLMIGARPTSCMIRTGWTGGTAKKANRLYRRDREGSAKGSASEGKGVREAGEKAGEVYQKGRGESAEEGRAGRAPQTAEGGAGRKACTLARMVEREAGAA